jgi:hypothetical protein
LLSVATSLKPRRRLDRIRVEEEQFLSFYLLLFIVVMYLVPVWPSLVIRFLFGFAFGLVAWLVAFWESAVVVVLICTCLRSVFGPRMKVQMYDMPVMVLNVSLDKYTDSSSELDEGDVIYECTYRANDSALENFVFTAYKTVDRKVRPVPTQIPESVRPIRQIPEDPLLTLPTLPFDPPEFVPDDRFTQERMDNFRINEGGFLLPEEEKLFKHVLVLNAEAIAFTEAERGTFKESYFSPYIIPTVPHTPWCYRNIPIPPGIRERVIELIQDKINNGVYELSQSAYRSRWFIVLKKNGKLRLVHDLQPLNAVSIKDAGLPPSLEDFTDGFAGRQIYSVFDLFWGFDARKIHPESRDLTTFHCPLGLLRLTALPMGYTNSPGEFQRCMTFVLKPEIPRVTNPFVDDVPIGGPKTTYPDERGRPKRLKENPGIRQFVFEHASDVHRVLHRLKCSGATIAPTKTQIGLPRVLIVGHTCSPEGRSPDDAKIKKILDWPELKTVKDVRGFLGLCGGVRIWIQDYSATIRPLTELYRKDVEFEWTEQRQKAFERIKHLVVTAPALRSIDYESDLPVILAVDTSKIAIGFILLQLDESNKRRPARYGSLPLNEVEARYSQAKLELYGLFRALRHWRIHLIGAKRLIVEVDAKYIKGMINSPDIQPNAAINRWVQGIMMFDFELVHVPATSHRGPDALSRRERAEHENSEYESDSWLDDIALLMTTNPMIEQSHAKRLKLTYQIGTMPSVLVASAEQNQELERIKHFLQTLETPEGLTLQKKQRFLRKAAQYFVRDDKLWRRTKQGMPRLVILDPVRRAQIIKEAHDDNGHRHAQAVFQTLRRRYYWPYLMPDIQHHCASCHQCQIFQIRKGQLPTMVKVPSTLFIRVYLDVMYMPKSSSGVRYIVAAKCGTSRWPEARAIRRNEAQAIADFLWEEVYCRHGCPGIITTDNGPETKAAFSELCRRHNLPQVRISAYNSQANGVIERGHFIMRQAIIKSCGDNLRRWPSVLHTALLADRVTWSEATGYSPYYLVYGVDPVLPFDLFDATFLVEGFTRDMNPVDLLALRIQQLERRDEDIRNAIETLYKSRLRSKERFDERYKNTILTKLPSAGDLVLVRNSSIEKRLDRKTKPRYLGPFEVVRRTERGNYVLKDLNGVVSPRAIGGRRIYPYIARDDLVQLAEGRGISEFHPTNINAETVFEHSSDSSTEDESSDEEADTYADNESSS